MSLGSGIYGMFLPIYYLNQGVAFQRIVFFLISICLGGALSTVLGNILIHRYGLKIFIITRGIIEPVTVLLARFYPVLHYPIELHGLMLGLISFSYWVSMDTITVKTTDPAQRGHQQNKLYSKMWYAIILSPFIGGYIITNFGYPLLFTSSLFLLLIGGILSLRLKIDVQVKRKLVLFPKLKENVGKHIQMIFFRGMTFVTSAYIIVLFLYMYLNDELLLGSFGLLVGVLSLIATKISGKIIDRYNKTNILFFLTLLQGIFWILVPFSKGIYLYVTILIASFFYQALNVPINTAFFNEIEKLDVTNLVSERLMMFCIGGAFFLVLFLFLDYSKLFPILGFMLFISLAVIRQIKT